MELLPRQARLFAWADPTGTRKLTWRYAANIGQHDLLKVSFDVNHGKGSKQASFTQISLVFELKMNWKYFKIDYFWTLDCK